MKFKKAIKIRLYMLIIGMFLVVLSMVIALFNDKLPYRTSYVFISNIIIAFIGSLLVLLAFKRGFLIDEED